MKKALALLLSLALMLSLIPAALAEEGCTITFGRTEDIQGLDPHKYSSTGSHRFFELVYNGLTVLDSELHVQPALAESWAISEDAMTYTFQIRKGVTFHDGTPLTAEDVKASYERILDTATGSPARSFFTTISGIEKTGDYEVVFHLSSPTVSLLTLMAGSNAMILAKKDIEAGTCDQVENGTGPFMMVERVPDSQIVLAKNPTYFEEGLPKADKVVLQVLPDESSILAALRAGTIDIGSITDVTNILLARNDGLNVMGGTGLNVCHMAVNMTNEYFSNPLVRQALNYGIDREEIVAAVSMNETTVAGPLSDVMSPEFVVDTSEYDSFTYNPEKAKELLAEAGYPNGFSFTIISFNQGNYPLVCQLLQAQLKKIGLDVKVEIYEKGVFVSLWKVSDFDAYVSSKTGSPDPDYSLYRGFVTGQSSNVTLYSNEKLDKLLSDARSELDSSKRAELYREAQKLLVDDGPCQWLFADFMWFVSRNNVKGFTYMPNQALTYLKYTYLE